MSDTSTLKSRRLIAAAAGLILLSVFGYAVYHQTSSSTQVSPVFTLPAEIPKSEYDRANKEYQRAYGRAADRNDTLSWLAEDSLRQNKLHMAAACFRLIPSSHPRYGHSARHQGGQALIRLEKAVVAEQQLREFLNLEEGHPQSTLTNRVDAKQRLRHLLEVQLRFEERKELLAEMVHAGRGDAFDTMYYCFPSLLRWNGPQAIAWLEGFLKENPGNLKLRIALGRYRTGQGRLDEAREILSRCRHEAPNNLFAIAADLARLRETGDWAAIQLQLSELSSVKATDPWMLLRIRGKSYNRQKKYQEAIRCFLYELKNNPASPEACLGLAEAYAGLNKPDQRKRMLEKAQVLARIQNRLGWGQSSPTDIDPFIEIATLCEQIELFEQAILIARLASRADPGNGEVRKLITRLKAKQPRSG